MPIVVKLNVDEAGHFKVLVFSQDDITSVYWVLWSTKTVATLPKGNWDWSCAIAVAENALRFCRSTT
jgi:hypothetical protein